MKRFRFAITTAALVVGGIGTAAVVHAGADPAVGRQVLDALCAEDRGAPVFTPYAIGRCQEARGMDGFPIERLVCEGLLDGSFTTAPAIGRPNRTNWACISG